MRLSVFVVLFSNMKSGLYVASGDLTKTERRLAAQYEIARALASCATLAEATPGILKAICEALRWDHGALWYVDSKANFLRCVETWHSGGR
ncbi:MAG: hypothetical protein DMG09_30705, partial [Acidobacteria bacterium]